MEEKSLKVIATGDMFITRRIAEDGYEGFEPLRDCIMKHDVKFSNLEMTFHNQEGAPAAESGGTWAMMEPEALDDIRRFGFNLYNTANNHTGDYGEGGVMATIRHLKERDMVFSGTGRNLGEASRACYLETRKGRVALISVSSTFSEASRAGGQSHEMQGRPGLNPLRHQVHYHVDQAHYEMAKELVDVTKINAEKEFSIRNGYSNPFEPGTLPFGTAGMFVLDEKNWTESLPNAEDMKRITEEIIEARKQADVVFVSFHGHECDGEDTTVPSMFLETFSRACIDAGAHAVIGHGPHELRGIEIYKGGVIFYSLGNFLFETETVGLQPYDAYINRGMPLDTKVGAYMDDRSKNGTVGYGVLENIWRAVMGAFTMENGKITQVQLYPITLGLHDRRPFKGLPRLSGDERTLEYLAGLSSRYGTVIRIENGIGYIDFT